MDVLRDVKLRFLIRSKNRGERQKEEMSENYCDKGVQKFTNSKVFRFCNTHFNLISIDRMGFIAHQAEDESNKLDVNFVWVRFQFHHGLFAPQNMS